MRPAFFPVRREKLLKTLAIIVLGLFFLVPSLKAQEPTAQYDNTIRIQYDFIHTGLYRTSFAWSDIGRTDAHVLLLSGAHSFNDRWTVFASLPYVQKRHKGAFPHNPNVDFVNFKPTDLRVIDDGTYHGGLQDFFGGVQYTAIEGPPFTLSPYISYGIPVTNYPFYASAAIGRHLKQLPVGVSLEYIPYFSDWEFRGDVAYVFSEKPLGVNVSYWLLYASASYYLTPRFVPKIYVTSRQVPHGLVWPQDFTDDYTEQTLEDFDTEWYYHHDQTLKHASTDAGIGFDYIVSDRYTIAGTFYRTIIADNVAEVEYAFTFALDYNF